MKARCLWQPNAIQQADGKTGNQIAVASDRSDRAFRERRRSEFPSCRAPLGPASAESGFTLVELLVAILIIGILIAIAIPTFLGARRRAADRAAQASLRIAVTAEMAYYSSQGSSFTDDSALLQAEEYGLYWIGPNPSTHFKEVSVAYYEGDFLCLAVQSPSGQSFGMVLEVVSPGMTWYGHANPTRASDFCSSHVPGNIPSPGNWASDPATGWAY
jgi:type IV pilus assembly protein PilA